MKWQIRKGVWETNSSSQHTLQISADLMKDCELTVKKDGYVHVNLNEYYGREFREYTTQEEKLKYICTWMFIYYGCDIEKLKVGYEWEKFVYKFCDYVNSHRNPKVRNYMCVGIEIGKIRGDGEVYDFLDHQSQPYGSFDQDGFILDIYDTDQLINFIFNPYVWLQTSSD